jgi:hypothetical protein
MVRIVTKVGDVFRVRLDESTCKYLQYIGNDLTYLNSDVIRGFSDAYPAAAAPKLLEVTRGEVDFYAHCSVNQGIRMGLWEKVGRVDEVGPVDILFRDTLDHFRRIDQEPIKVARNWRVWRVNEPMRDVGELRGVNRKAEVGIVMSPHSIMHRFRTGEEYPYPAYE